MANTKEPDDATVKGAQAEQMYGNAAAHAPSTPKRLDYELNNGIPSSGAPPAQGPNISKEESEFAAAAIDAGVEVPEEKIPAPTQASDEPVSKPGKAPKK